MTESTKWAADKTFFISLPPGILVVTEETSGTMLHISQPLSGWVDASSLLPLDLRAR